MAYTKPQRSAIYDKQALKEQIQDAMSQFLADGKNVEILAPAPTPLERIILKPGNLRHQLPS